MQSGQGLCGDGGPRLLDEFVAVRPCSSLSARLPVRTENSIRVDHVSESPNRSGDDRSVLRLLGSLRRSIRRADLRQRARLCVSTRLGHKNIHYTELAPDRLKNFWR